MSQNCSNLGSKFKGKRLLLPSYKASIPAVLVKMPKEKVRIQSSGVVEDGGGFFWYVLLEIEWTSSHSSSLDYPFLTATETT